MAKKKPQKRKAVRGLKGETAKLHKRGQHHCLLAVDTKTGEILASLEYEPRYAQDGQMVEIYVHGLNKTLKPSKCAYVGAHKGHTYYRDCNDKLHMWAVVNWNKWVSYPFKSWYSVHVGGGPNWPMKCIGIKQWAKKGKKHVDHQG